MATFAKLAGVNLPERDREGQPIIFDSYDMSPILFGTGKSARKSWFYFTENELTPGAARVGHYKAVFNLRGDDGTKTGGLAVTRIWAGRARSLTWRLFRKSLTCGRTLKSAMTSL